MNDFQAEFRQITISMMKISSLERSKIDRTINSAFENIGKRL